MKSRNLHIPESDNKDSNALQSFVNDEILKNVLKSEPVCIDRIHRLGRPRANGNRPVILKFTNFTDKAKLVKQCFRLKGINCSVSDGFWKMVRDVRRQLWNFAEPKKEASEKVSFAYDKLWNNANQFPRDASKEEAVLAASRRLLGSHAKNRSSEQRSALHVSSYAGNNFR